MRVFSRVIECIDLFFSIFSILCKIVHEISVIRKEFESMKDSKIIKESLSDIDVLFENLKEKIKNQFSKPVEVNLNE